MRQRKRLFVARRMRLGDASVAAGISDRLGRPPNVCMVRMRRFLQDTAKFTLLLLTIFVGVGTIYYSQAEILDRSALSWARLGFEIAAVALGFGASCAGMLWFYDWLNKHTDSDY